MPDLKKLYTPNEASALYNSCKIKFDPTSYSLKEHLILNKNLSDAYTETIASYNYDTEQDLVNAIKHKEAISTELQLKIDTDEVDKFVKPCESDCAAIKEYNLSIALDYLTTYCKVYPTEIKNSSLMEAIVRMCVALDSAESCSKELYWAITNLWNVPYIELHNFEFLKKAFETKPLKLPIFVTHNGADILYNDIHTNNGAAYPPICETDALRAAVLYRAYFYTMEFLWAYLRLRDADLQRAIAWQIQSSGSEVLHSHLFTSNGVELVIPDEVLDIVGIDNPADRFAAYQSYMQQHDNGIIVWAESNAPVALGKSMNPIVAMFVGYAEDLAVTHVRVNTIAMLYAYCKEQGYLNYELEDELNTRYSSDAGIGGMLGEASTESTDKSLMTLNKGNGAGGGSGGGYKGNSGIFEALDQLTSKFEDGGYFFETKDVYSDSPEAEARYNAICTKVRLLNKSLTEKIRNIKVYNTGGKQPGVASGRLDRKALSRYKWDPNIFYNNTYKQLESDLAFGIILDQSGSMAGDGITNGRITMILLHETLKALGINHCIVGHTSEGGDHHCTIERYQAFREDSTHNTLKNYALADLSAHSCNCDSGVLYYMEKAMERVRNRDKIVMIFSDGYPTACTGTELINQVHHMEKNGIKVIGIGIDFASISKYYTEYANGRNLTDMLNIVTDILQEYILKKKVD